MSHVLAPDKMMLLGLGFWGSKTFPAPLNSVCSLISGKMQAMVEGAHIRRLEIAREQFEKK
jgi:hypothetical protein